MAEDRVEAECDVRLVEVADRRGNAFQLDEAAFRANVAQTRGMLPSDVKIYQCVKGDGYGIGLERIVGFGVRAEVDGFCVGTPEEALRAKRVAGNLPVLLFAGCRPATVAEMVGAGVIASISSVESFAALMHSGAVGECFFKLDCGFRRYGLNEQALRTVLDMYRQQSAARCVGIYSHFGSRCDEIVEAALPLFDQMADRVEQAVEGRIETMVASSTLVLHRPDLAYSAVDPGRLLYGMMPVDSCPSGFRPLVPRISSTLLQVTPFEKSQVLPVGYAEKIAIPAGGKTGVFPLGWIDGLSTRGGFGEVIVRGTRVPVIARTLQHSIVNLSGVADVRVGDEIVVVGEQGHEQITLEAMATAQGVSIPEVHMRLLAAISASSAKYS